MTPDSQVLLRQGARHAAVSREAELLAGLSSVVAAFDHPPDGTQHTRMRAAIAEARELLSLAPVNGTDGEPA